MYISHHITVGDIEQNIFSQTLNILFEKKLYNADMNDLTNIIKSCILIRERRQKKILLSKYDKF